MPPILLLLPAARGFQRSGNVKHGQVRAQRVGLEGVFGCNSLGVLAKDPPRTDDLGKKSSWKRLEF